MPVHRRSIFNLTWSVRGGRSLQNVSKFLPDYTALLLMTSVFIIMSLNSLNLTFVSWLRSLLTVLLQVWPDRKLRQWERRPCSWQLGRRIYSAGPSRWNRYVMSSSLLHGMQCMFGVKHWRLICICFIKNTLIFLSVCHHFNRPTLISLLEKCDRTATCFTGTEWLSLCRLLGRRWESDRSQNQTLCTLQQSWMYWWLSSNAVSKSG